MFRFGLLMAIACVATIFASKSIAAPIAGLTVKGSAFELTTAAGRVYRSTDLVGAVFDMQVGDGPVAQVRIDAVEPSAENASVLLHRFSVLDRLSGEWRSMCEPDAKGRQAGFPVAGAWDGKGGYVKDASRFFVTCTSGSQGKCILWGYDPWSRGAHGEDLAAYYQACQHMVRADYDGKGRAFTKNGTTIDMWDLASVQKADSLEDASFRFEAGWGPDGAVCVAHTRWSDLLTTEALISAAPHLKAASCDEAEARRRGALLFNRSR